MIKDCFFINLLQSILEINHIVVNSKVDFLEENPFQYGLTL